MESSEHQESYMTVAEVAEVLKLNQQTVRNWIDQGSLPALRVGRRVRIKRSDFERVLQQSYSGGAAATGEASLSAEDFWGGTPVGLAEPNPGAAPGLGAVSGPGARVTTGATTDPGPGLTPDRDRETDPPQPDNRR
jgi:excisionase family DNA binding protein